MITFMPNRNRVFKGESITMTCNMGNHNWPYVWLKDSQKVDTYMYYYTIPSAQVDHSGFYYCSQTVWMGVPIESETVRLEVIDGEITRIILKYFDR